MPVEDKTRYKTADPDKDFPGLGLALCQWIKHPGIGVWRQFYFSTNPLFEENPDTIFSSVRYASFDITLRLAAWEITRELPEAEAALNRAAMVAYRAIRYHCGEDWDRTRTAWGSKGMRQALAAAINIIERCELVVGKRGLGRFVEKNR